MGRVGHLGLVVDAAHLSEPVQRGVIAWARTERASSVLALSRDDVQFSSVCVQAHVEAFFRARQPRDSRDLARPIAW